MAEHTDSRLRAEIEAIELIDSEIDDLRGLRRERMAALKEMGYDLATVRRLLARRKLTPAERGVADALLEAYECALGGEAPAVPLRASAADLAADLLAAQIDGISDPERAAAVVDHVLALLDIRAEIAVLREQERARRGAAGADGFDTNQIALTVRWYEKCAKHGADMMKAGEQVFHLYRATVDEAGGPVRPQGDVTADEKLAALFAQPAPKAPTKKQKSVADAIALARLNRRSGQ